MLARRRRRGRLAGLGLAALSRDLRIWSPTRHGAWRQAEPHAREVARLAAFDLAAGGEWLDAALHSRFICAMG